MKKTVILLLTIFLSVFPALANGFADEILHYKVMYKWGLINKQAGDVVIALRNDGKEANGLLTAASAPWADRYYKVRDTLKVNLIKETMLPTVYEKFAHEGNEYNRDKVEFVRNGTLTIGNCTRFKMKNGEVKKDEKRTLEGEGTSLDMFSAFYYMRSLPYADMNPGTVTRINIFSGKQKELLSITYHGRQQVEYDGLNYDCYKITFVFTSDGKKKSSDDMEAWIDTRTLIPIKLVGKLPVGSVQALYVK